MRNENKDETLVRNYIEQYQFIIKEYELIKEKKHPQFRYLEELYKAHNICRSSFHKYYHRFKQSGNKKDLLPQNRGPKYKTRRPLAFIENKVLELRNKGNNRYEIHHILKPSLKKFTPSPSGVYNILKRHGLNNMLPKMKENKRKIIKKRAGELGHIDVHYLSKNIVKGENKRRYLVCVIDDYSRLIWGEMINDIKSLTVMFATLRTLNIQSDHYGIKYEEILSDNGSEFGRKESKVKQNHPFERMLVELGIKHRYTRPYRPQTNGKIERFWRTIEDDMLRETTYNSEEELKEEFIQYLYYYNHERPHQGIGGMSPAEFLKLSANY